MRWAEEQRMMWLSERLEPFNRKDLMGKFRISIPQASNDIRRFLQINPGVWTYNTKKKRYERIENV